MQELTDGQKKIRLEGDKELLCLYESGQLSNLVIYGEKPFQIEQFVNKQNDWVALPKFTPAIIHQKSSAA